MKRGTKWASCQKQQWITSTHFISHDHAAQREPTDSYFPHESVRLNGQYVFVLRMKEPFFIKIFLTLKYGLSMEIGGTKQQIWVPVHSGVVRNECAHDAARGFVERADVETSNKDAHSIRRSGRDRLVHYRDIIDHYRLERARYPAPDRTLSK